MPENATVLQVGARIAETYEVVRLIGRGGMGEGLAVQPPAPARQAGRREGAAHARRRALGRCPRPLQARGRGRLAHRPPEHRRGARLQHAPRRSPLPRPRVPAGREPRVAPALRSDTARRGDAADPPGRQRARREPPGRSRSPRLEAGQHLPRADSDGHAGEGARLRHLEGRRLEHAADGRRGAGRHSAGT